MQLVRRTLVLLVFIACSNAKCAYTLHGSYLGNPSSRIIAIRFMTSVIDVTGIDGFEPTAFPEKYTTMIIIGLPCDDACDNIKGHQFHVNYTTGSSFCNKYNVSVYAYDNTGAEIAGILPSYLETTSSAFTYYFSFWCILMALL